MGMSLEQYIEMGKHAPKMIVSEVRALALEYYQRGGDIVWEYWDDLDIQERLNEGCSKEDWITLFNFYLANRLDVEGTIW